MLGISTDSPKASVRNPGVNKSPAANSIIAPSVSRSGEIWPLAKFFLILENTELTDRLARIAPMTPDTTTTEIENAHPVYEDMTISNVRSTRGTAMKRKINLPSTTILHKNNKYGSLG
jgi:hypothetical protein